MTTSSTPRATAPRTRPEQQQKSSNQRPILVVIGIITIAVIAAVVAIVGSNNPQGAVVDYTAIPQSRTDDGGFVLGNPDAPVTIVEFADFTCPHCQEYHETVIRFINEYVATGKAKFEYRMYPIVDPAFAEYAAQIAECGADVKPNGGFWEAHDILFQLGSSGRLSDTTTRQVADRMGIDYSALLDCTRTAEQYQTDFRLGQQLGIQGTPGIMVRYGDGAPSFITLGGTTYNRGGVSYNILQTVVEAAQ